jgi:hypothetical protein
MPETNRLESTVACQFADPQLFATIRVADQRVVFGKIWSLVGLKYPTVRCTAEPPKHLGHEGTLVGDWLYREFGHERYHSGMVESS